MACSRKTGSAVARALASVTTESIVSLIHASQPVAEPNDGVSGVQRPLTR